MSFTAYATAIAGSVLTAAFWNQQVRDNGVVLKTSIADDGSIVAGVLLDAPELKNFTEVAQTVAIAGGVLTLDLGGGCEFEVPLDQDVTAIVVTNVPPGGGMTTLSVKFLGDGTPRAVTYPAAWRWAGSSAPTPTGTSGKADIVTAKTYNGGTVWYPSLFTQNA